MNKMAFVFAAAFSLITVFAIATDYMQPHGFYDTPKVSADKNIRERSVSMRGTHRGFMHGK